MERGVILDEIAMYEDMGEDLAHEALCGTVWPASPMGWPVCGRPDTVAAVTSPALRRYVNRTYTPERILVVLTGHFVRDDLLQRLEQALGTRPRGAGPSGGGYPRLPPRHGPAFQALRAGEL